LAVRIRLTRVGATKRPAYRVIAIDKRRSRDGRALEILGFYDPLTEPATVQLDTEKINAWIGKGAQPSETVVKLMAQAERAASAGGEPEKPKRATRAKKPSKKAAAKAQAEAEAPAAEPEAPAVEASPEPEAAAADTGPEPEPAAAEAVPEASVPEPEAVTDEPAASEDETEKAEA
jgi:small subunit ribosomal protein S16